jgi:hypothetical protein
MTFVSTTAGCIPSVFNGPSDTILALSGAETGVFPYVVGTPTKVANQISTASSAFNFSDAYIGTIPSTPVTYTGFPIGTSAVSASAWVNCPSFTTQAQSSIFEWGAPALATSVLKFSLSALGSAGQALPGPSSGLCDGKWHHVAQVYQGGINGALTRYVDGVVQTSTTATFALPQVGSAIRIGWNGGASTSVFSTPGSSSWTVPAGVKSVNVLVVGGGGGGGGSSDRTAGGGGAGGFRCVESVPVTPGQVIPISVGAGGGGGSGGSAGGLGGTSSFGTLVIASGGGGGGGNVGAAGSGGSGGGKFHGSASVAGNGIAGQGNGGGTVSYDSGQAQGTFVASGGGGASTRGSDGTMFGGGNGGIGAQCLAVGSTSWYSGGGGGAAQSVQNQNLPGGIGGIGGGGNGGVGTGAGPGTAATPNTGGGGGGGSTGGSGGSGIVIISFASSGVTIGPYDSFAGSIADVRLYSRALTATEVLYLSNPPLLYVGPLNPIPVATSTLTTYTYTTCTPGYAGSVSYVWTKQAASNAWVRTGTSTCSACGANQYAHPGAATCATCNTANGWSLASPTKGCTLGGVNGPTDVAFSLSGTGVEAGNAFKFVTSGTSYIPNRIGTASSALNLINQAYLATSAYASVPVDKPVDNNPMSITALVKCAPFVDNTYASVFEWGAPAAAISPTKLAISVASAGCDSLGSTSLPAPFPGACDNKWHSLIVTHGEGSSTTMKQYMDGVLIKSSVFVTMQIPSILANLQLRVGYNGGIGSLAFKTVGTSSFTVPVGVSFVNILMVGGGGGGGGGCDRTAGGGGGGGVLCVPNVAVTAGNVYNMVVGAGGLAGVGCLAGSNGGNSYIQLVATGAIIAAAAGGGGGGGQGQIGQNGGSGGGRFHGSASSAGTGTTGQGNAGGPLGYDSGSGTGTFTGSGGGGAGGVGLSGTASGGGAGGPGAYCSFVGDFFGGGGGGAAQSLGGQALLAGAGGRGGGGRGYTDPITVGGASTSGTPNTGGGGGGYGGNGGSGIIALTWIAPNPRDDYYTGVVSDMRVYNRALSQAEVEQIAEPPLVPIANYVTPIAKVGSLSYTWTCPAGKWGPTQSLVKNLVDNSWTTTGATGVCTDCGQGFYCPAGATSGTEPCAAGFYCPGGLAPAPVPCPAGTSSVLGSISLSQCFNCGAGNFTTGAGGECKVCAAGTYSSGPANSTCTSCPAGTYGNPITAAQGLTSIADCILCPPGYFSGVVGAAASSSCLTCSPGIFCPSGTSVSTQLCPAGSYCPGNGLGPELCNPGTANNVAGSTECFECVAGAWTANFGSTVCTDCPAGSYSTAVGATKNTCTSTSAPLKDLAWTRVPPPMSSLSGRSSSVAVSSGSTGIFIGGNGGSSSKKYPPRLIYSPNSGALYESADNSTGLNNYYSDRAATTSTPDGRTWSFGGIDASGKETAIMAFWHPSTPGFGWTIVSPPATVPPARKNGAMSYLSNCTSRVTSSLPYECFVLFGGDISTSASTITRFGDLWLYFPETNTWLFPTQAQTSATNALPPPTTGMSIAASIGGMSAYLFGGSTASGASSELYVFDPSGMFFSDPNVVDMKNLALGKTTKMSTEVTILAFTGTPTSTCSSSFATDGLIPVSLGSTTRTCNMAISAVTCTGAPCFGALPATGGERMPWFYVDLGSTQSFDSIAIYTRNANDMGSGRWSGFQIWYSNVNTPEPSLTPTPSTPPGQRCLDLPPDVTGQSAIMYCSGQGRYIWIYFPPSPTTNQYIVLSEIQVLQRAPYVWRRLSGYTNVAASTTAFASSTYFNGNQGGDASYVVDGALVNFWPNLAHTAATIGNPPGDCNNVFITVDLGKEYSVSEVALWPRIECCRTRSRRISIYIGNNRDWRGNTLVLSNADLQTTGPGVYYSTCPNRYGVTTATAQIAAGTQCWSYSFPKAYSGRYVTARKIPFNANNCQLHDTAGGDENVINIGEFQVWAQRLANQPSARAFASFSNYRGTLTVAGGVDAGGFYLDTVDMFDLTTNTWRPRITPLGTRPAGRIQSSLLALPNITSSGYNEPSNVMLLTGGFDSSGNALGDMNVLTLPKCSPSPMVALNEYLGIKSEVCTNAGTVCSYTCQGGFIGAPANGPSNTIVCSPEGVWIGSIPVCIPPDSASFQAPVASSTSVVPSGFFGAKVSWVKPGVGIWSIQGYRVTAKPVDFIETFVNWNSANSASSIGFKNPSVWSVAPTETGSSSVYFFDKVTGALVINNAQGAGTGGTASVGGRYDAMNVLRTFPQAETGLNPDGDWAVETYLWVDTTTSNQIAANQDIGFCIYDNQLARNLFDTLSTTNGACRFWAGIRMSSTSRLQYGWQSLNAPSAAAPAYTANGWSNWYTSPQNNVWIRIERLGLQGSKPSLGGSWRAAFKFQPTGDWQYMTDIVTDARLGVGGAVSYAFPSLSTNLRFGFIARNALTTVNRRAFGYFSYLRVTALGNCNAPGSTRYILNTTTTTAVIQGLSPGKTYQFAVQTIMPAGFLSLPTIVQGSVTTPSASSTQWAANIISHYNNKILVDALSATPYVKTTYQVSVWNNDVNNFGPAKMIDGLADTGANQFAQAGFRGLGYWNPAGPLASKANKDSYTGTAWVGGSNTFTQDTATPSVDPLGDWWAVDLGIQTSVKTIFISGRQNTCCVERSVNVEFWIGNSPPPYWNNTARCDPSLMPVANLRSATATVTDPYTGINRAYSGFFQCELSGRYVYMRAPGIAGTVTGFGLNAFDGQFNVGEVRIYASNKCPPRTGTNVITNTPIACSGTNVTGGSVYGAVCVQSCPTGYTVISGSGIANCDGDNWDQPPLVCSPTCPVLQAPSLIEKCTQFYFRDEFLTPLSLTSWFSPSPRTQGIGMTWFAPDGFLVASNSPGCNDQMLLLPQSAKIAAYVGDFSISASISPQGATQAGLVFFVDSLASSYMRFTLDASGLGRHKLERVVKGVITLLTDSRDVTVLPNSRHDVIVNWVASTGGINVTVNGKLIMALFDNTFTQGLPGLFASTTANFYSFAYGVPCNSGCANALAGEICVFSCQTGLLATGPTARTCIAEKSAWVPSVVDNPTLCTVPPPVFYSTTLDISEAAPKNAPVGQPLVGYSIAPDYQLQWAILSEDGGPPLLPPQPDIPSLFFIDSCSGQVKLRVSGVMDVFTWTRKYTLIVRASIAGFVGIADTVRNITVNVIQVDTPPVMLPTTLTLTENSEYFSPISPLVGFPIQWDRENSTAFLYKIAVDTSDGLFVINPSTGGISLAGSSVGCSRSNSTSACRSSKLNYESINGNSFNLVVSLQQTSYCCDTAPFPAVTGSVVIQLADANDAPTVPSGQVLSIQDSLTSGSVVIGSVLSEDEDGSSSAFFSSPSYTLVSATTQSLYPSCSISGGLNGGLPTVDGSTTGSLLFDISSAGAVSIRPGATFPTWNSITPFSAYGVFARRIYTVCVNVTDGTEWSIGGVTVAVTADTLSTPVIYSWDAATTLDTRGGETILFNGTGFSTTLSVSATYTSGNTGDIIYQATDCVKVNSNFLSCKTAPGVGANLQWTVRADNIVVPSLISLSTSYKAPYVTGVSSNINQLNTDGTTTNGLSIVFTGTPGTFPPNSTYPISIRYGAGLEYSCDILSNGVESVTTLRCKASVGFGTSLSWSLTVGGQTTTSSAYSNSWPLFGYLRPSISSISPSCAPTPCTPTFSLSALDTAGNERIAISGTNFGSATAPTVISFGGSGGVAITLVCTVGTNPHTDRSCVTPPGIGTQHAIMVNVGGQTLTAPFGSNNYKPPVITRVSGAGQVGSPTPGGATITIDGQQFGPVSGVLGMSTSDTVTYGHFPSDLQRYSAEGCRVTASPDITGGSTWTMQCSTAEGVGNGHAIVMTLGGQRSSVYLANISYANPQIASYSGAGSNRANTAGGQEVIITGTNFGPGTSNSLYTSYFSTLLRAEYGVQLKDGPFTNLTLQVTSCSVSKPHIELTCATVAGAGKNLVWKVTLDGLESTMPTTNYAPPEITGLTGANANIVDMANVNGGTQLFIVGKFFGPFIFGKALVQSITFGFTGSEVVLSPMQYTVLNQTHINATLPPGTGQNLKVQVQVADQVSLPSDAVFSYAPPEIIAIVPPSAPTESDPRSPTIITIVAKNLPLLDPLSRIGVLFGNEPFSIQRPPAVPQGAAAVKLATNPDGSANVTFPLPNSGSAQNVAVRITITPVGSTNPSFISPVVYRQGTASEYAASFSYQKPTIDNVIVSRARFVLPAVMGGPNTTAAIDAEKANGAVPCPFPYDPVTGAQSGAWNCKDLSLKLIEINGWNFGLYPNSLPDPTSNALGYPDGVSKLLETLVFNTSLGVEFWDTTNLFLYSWSHYRIAFYSPSYEGVLRLTQSNFGWNNNPVKIVIQKEFKNVNPEIIIDGASKRIDVPTTGGDPSGALGALGVIDASLGNIVSCNRLDIWVGSYPVPATNIINPTTNTRFANDAAVASYLNSQSSSGSIRIRFVLPPGQGAGLSIIVINNQAGGVALQSSANDRATSYAKPVIQFVQVFNGAQPLVALSTVNVPLSPGAFVPEVIVPTDGSRKLRIMGMNLGLNPVVIVGDQYRLDSSFGVTACSSTGETEATSLGVSTTFTAGHRCIELTAPAGEGNGLLFPDLYPNGFYILKLETEGLDESVLIPTQVSAQLVRFSYAPPIITSVVPTIVADGKPTKGGVEVIVSGSNFGVWRSLSGRAVTSIAVTFTVPGVGDPFDCLNEIRNSQTEIRCILPEGSGKDLTVSVNVAGVAGSTAQLFSYTPPSLANVALVPFDKWQAATNASLGGIGEDLFLASPTLYSDAASLPGTVSGAPGSSLGGLFGSTVGGDILVLSGDNFGAADPRAHCAFLAWTFRSNSPSLVPTCDFREGYIGEGEVAPGQVLLWTHTLIIFRSSEGLGTKDIELSIRGSTLTAVYPRNDPRTVRFRYAAPIVSQMVLVSPSSGLDIQPATGDVTRVSTEGGTRVALIGSNFGPTPTDFSIAANRIFTPDGVSVNVSLANAAGLPTAKLVIAFHRTCVVKALQITGLKSSTAFKPWFADPQPITMDQCDTTSISSISHSRIELLSAPGIGAQRIARAYVVEDASLYPAALPLLTGLTPVPGVAQFDGNWSVFSYNSPSISSFNPSIVSIEPRQLAEGEPNFPGIEQTIVNVQGNDFGDPALAKIQSWSVEESQLSGTVGGIRCASLDRTRPLEGVSEIVCRLPSDALLVGYRNVTVTVAGQRGSVSEYRSKSTNPLTGFTTFFQPLLLKCAPGYFAHWNETCQECPAQYPETPQYTGAQCDGFNDKEKEFADKFVYPRPLKGWYNLNSSDRNTIKWGNPGDSQFSACPELDTPIMTGRATGRDVCIVPCDPPESCIGNNFCAVGYASKPPLWKCSNCDTGYYRQASGCVKCPDSPWALVIGFVLLVTAAGFLGYLMNQKNVNIAVISIGIDFFQVLAIFATSGVKWPPVVRELLHILSAFNLNIEIVAPECIVPDLSYKAKFWFIMLLPIFVSSTFILSFVGILFEKAIIRGQNKKEWYTHKPALVASGLALLYILYLYLTRTIFDVFNCTPTMPPDGYLHLSVAGGERCGVPGGTHLTLIPYAVAGLIVYTFGYPGFVFYVIYTNQELVMLDQLLRAKGTGDDRLSNPRAYELRITYGRNWFQFKPDRCYWILVILLRKFFISITAVVFSKNSSFQMAACLMVMFLAYSAQVMARPYMNAGEFEDVLRDHMQSSLTNVMHARIRKQIQSIEARGRKRVRKNLLNFEGKVDRSAVLGVLTTWLFNYNTIEQLMIFAAVIVCLMGIMYQANTTNTFYPGALDGVTAVVMITIIAAILYFATVVITEMVILYNESASHARAKRAMSSRSASLKAKGESKKKLTTFDSDGNPVEETFNTGAIDSMVNPIFVQESRKESGATGSLAVLLNQYDAPSQEQWATCKIEIEEALRAAQQQQSESGGGGGARGIKKKKDFAPVTA